MLRQIFGRARMEAASGTRAILRGVLELDVQATNAHQDKIPAADIYRVKSLQNGGDLGAQGETQWPH